jgi:tRNA(His) 5'-end guanylyltransferase
MFEISCDSYLLILLIAPELLAAIIVHLWEYCERKQKKIPLAQPDQPTAIDQPTALSPKPSRDPVGDDVKALELATPSVIPSDKFIVVRLDGRSFHTFTRPFDKPIDADLTRAMVLMTHDVCKEFGACLGYTQSDEATFILAQKLPQPDGTLQPHIFNGRKQKIESLFAAYASVRLNYWLCQYANQKMPNKKFNQMVSGTAHMDARAIAVSDVETLGKIVSWRHITDCYKNGISAFAYSKFPHKELEHKSTAQRLKMLNSMGIDIADIPPHLLYGTFVLPVLTDILTTDKKTGHVAVAHRRRFQFFRLTHKNNICYLIYTCIDNNLTEDYLREVDCTRYTEPETRESKPEANTEPTAQEIS